jgi:transcriptional regulator with XRE-family HTH domain
MSSLTVTPSVFGTDTPRERHHGPPLLSRERGALFAQRLCARREQLGLSQTQLERRCGLGNGTVSAYEKGRRGPTITLLIKLADQLNVTTDWLTGRDTLPADPAHDAA